MQLEVKGKNVLVMRTYDEFRNTVDKYTIATVIFDPIKFDTGQVILIDDGETDNCSSHLAFNSNVSTENINDASFKIILDYVVKPQLPSGCIPTDPKVRPFYFYYVKSRKLLILEDKPL